MPGEKHRGDRSRPRCRAYGVGVEGHPFREGNGRIARMLAALMGLQAGLPALDFSGIRGRRRKEYFAAVHAGVARDYRPMEKIFTAVIRRTFRKRA